MTRYILAIALAIYAFPAQGQTVPCGPTAEMERVLTEKHGEERVGVALQRGSLVGFWRNKETGTWLVTSRAPNTPGFMCIIASGTAWQDVPPSEKKQGKGS
jgi:hypothetical protein